MDKPLSTHLKAFILPVFMLLLLPAGINLLEWHIAGRPLVSN
jgi:hypothetical protein